MSTQATNPPAGQPCSYDAHRPTDYEVRPREACNVCWSTLHTSTEHVASRHSTAELSRKAIEDPSIARVVQLMAGMAPHDRARCLAAVAIIARGDRPACSECGETLPSHESDCGIGSRAREQSSLALTDALPGYVHSSGCDECGNDPGRLHGVTCSKSHEGLARQRRDDIGGAEILGDIRGPVAQARLRGTHVVTQLAGSPLVGDVDPEDLPRLNVGAMWPASDDGPEAWANCLQPPKRETCGLRRHDLVCTLDKGHTSKHCPDCTGPACPMLVPS